MELSKIIEEFQLLLKEIKNKKFYLYLSYPLTIVYFGIPLRRWSRKKLNELSNSRDRISNNLKSLVNNSVDKAQKEYSDIEHEDTYLIFSKKDKINSLLEEYLKNLKDISYYSDVFDEKFNAMILSAIHNIKQVFKKTASYNAEFIIRRKIKYRNLWKLSSVNLDDDQLTAIVTDDKHNLVIAGAGSGKTEVLISRIAYLINRKPDTIEPNRILALAFQKKAAHEIAERLKERYNINIKVKTFHALGKEILESDAKINKKKIQKLKFSGDNFDKEYREFIKKVFLTEVENSEIKNEIVEYMRYYGDSDIKKEQTDFETKEEYYKYMQQLRYTALDGTKVKSDAERDILNFFVKHNLNGNKINIIYEAPATWMEQNKYEKNDPLKPDFYFPDFDLYLEHWSLDKKGRVPFWFSGENPTEEYKNSMEHKKAEFRKQTKYSLIETYSYEYNESNFQEKLKKRFLEAIQNKQNDTPFILEPILYEELVERVWEECRASVNTLSNNIGNFIIIAKTYKLLPSDIKKRLVEDRWSLKQKAFADIAIRIYEIYQNELKKDDSIDFSDMINLAVEILKENKSFYKDLYDHILIDEYQDISRQRYDLIKGLMNKNINSKLFCVGDDWQSIMGFAGSNLDFFINFDKYFDHHTRTDLTINYRSI
ncbi:MAG: UvrD-helicase domain-containing protein [Candidatus Woesearchaeota archaeon]|nr:UvrD-helicase domain-containing protein [Candidatus Woesearchaeota archaeon]